MNALGEFFTEGTSNRDTIQIGSVKSSIGHLEGAAGVVGLIKLLLMMEHETVVKSLFYTEETGNPKIDFHRYKMKVPTTQHAWITGKDGIRTGCVNSFGFGGTNAHLTVHTINKEHKVVSDHGIYIVGLSAPNDESLVETAKGYLKDIEAKTYSMDTLSYTSMCKRDHLQSRVSFTAKSQTELTAQVRAFLNGTVQGPHGSCPPQCEVVFVYCGVGTTWTGMCRELLHQQEFRTAVSEVDSLLKPLTGWSILSKLEAGEDVADAMVGPLAIFTCQIGLASLWMHYGLVPDKILGQSVGEVAAAYTAGCIDLNTAVHVIYHRTHALAEVTGGGMMVVKNCDVHLVDQYCKQSNGNINIAVYNSPVSCTVSGSKGGLADLKQKLEKRITNGKLFTSVLNVNCAYHSPQVAAAADSMVKNLVNIFVKKGHIPLYSSVTGKVVENGLFGLDSYWKMNVCQPVLFHDVICSAIDPNVHTVFVEIGPSPVLRAHASDIISNSNNSYNVLPSMTKQNEELTFLQTAASLFSIGIPMSWMKVVSMADEIVPIPKYAFQRSPLIYEAELPLTKPGVTPLVSESNDFKHLYIMRSKSSRESIVLNISEATSAFIFTHFVNEQIIIPGATYADVGFVIGAKLKGLTLSSVVVSLDFVQAIRIRSGSVNELKVTVHDAGPTVNFTVESGPTVACTGQVTNSKTCSISTVNLPELRLQLPTKIYSQDSYTKLNTMGFRYGPQFTLMRNGYSDGRRCLVDIELHPTMTQDLNDLIIHPCILDVMIQTTGNLISDELASTVQNTQLRMLPMAIGSIRVYGKFQRNMVVYATTVSQISLPTMVKGHYNIALLDIHGHLIAEVENFVMHGKYTGTNSPDEMQYVLKWEELSFSDIGAGTHNDKLLVINGSDTILKPLSINDSTTIATCQLQYDEWRHPDDVMSILNHVARQKWNGFEDVTGIIFVCDSDSRLDEPEDVSRIYNMVTSNIIGVSGLLKALMDSDFQPPIFVVTECVQEAYITGEKCHVSLVGSELWGYVRNLHVELMYKNVSLVDISPSLQFAGCYFSHLLRSINSSATVTSTDYAIVRDRIYSPCLVKTSMTEISPTHCIVGQPMAKQYSVKSCSPTDILNLYTTDVVDDLYTLPHKTDVVEIATETVCVSNAAFYPKTTTDRDGIHAPWSSGSETGYHVLAMEYIGLEFENCTR
ncbi:MAG: acyltransferase domain-containing protein, partial [Sedimenticola sp.]